MTQMIASDIDLGPYVNHLTLLPLLSLTPLISIDTVPGTSHCVRILFTSSYYELTTIQ